MVLSHSALAVLEIDHVQEIRAMAVNQMNLNKQIITLANAREEDLKSYAVRVNQQLETPKPKRKKRRVVKKKLVKRTNKVKKVSKPKE